MNTKHTKQYEDYCVEIVLNPKLKHSYLRVTTDAKVIVKTPERSISFVDSIVRQKHDWICKQLAKIDRRKKLPTKPLHTVEYLYERVEYFSKLMQLQYKKVRLKKMRSRWGSCSSKGNISLNLELLKLPSKCVDYVIVHELAHLVHMNHSKAFHNLVEHYISDAKVVRKELKSYLLG